MSLRDLLICGVLITGVSLCSVTAAFALSSPYRTVASGVQALVGLEVGESTVVSLSTPEGIHSLELTRVMRRLPRVSVDGMAGNVPELQLFRGRLRGKGNSRASFREISASYYRGELTIKFQGNRKRSFSARFRQISQKTGRIEGRLHHTPSVLYSPCATEIAVDSVAEFADSVSAATTDAPYSGYQVNVGVDADKEYYEANGSDESATLAALEAIINSVNAIYSAQLGIEVVLKSYNIFTTDSQPYTSSKTDKLLQQFGDYVNDNSGHLTGDLKHLITGKDTSYQGNSSVAGLAYQGVVCSSPQASIGLSERVYSSIQHIVVAHEIGHNFGAGHASTKSIMYSSSGPGQETFSDYSIGEITAHVDDDPSCLKATSSGDVKFKAKLSSKDKVSFKVTPQTFSAESCTVEIYGSTKESKLSDDYSEATLIVSSSGTAQGEKQKFKFKNATKTPRKDTRYRAVITCGGDTYESSVKKIKADSGSGDLKSVGAKRFFSYLSNKLSS